MSDQDDNKVHPLSTQVLSERAAELSDKVAEAQNNPAINQAQPDAALARDQK